MFELPKILSISGLLVDLIGVMLLFYNEKLYLDERKTMSELPEADFAKAFNDAVDGKTPPPKPTIDFVKESNHRQASIKNNPKRSRSRILTAYFILGVGFLLQALGVILK